jgi:hypothetical protein
MHTKGFSIRTFPHTHRDAGSSDESCRIWLKGNVDTAALYCDATHRMDELEVGDSAHIVTTYGMTTVHRDK